MTKTTSFQTDIRPLFTERDIRGMSKAFNLGSYDDVKKHAAAIYDRIRGIGGAVMPPPPPMEKVLGRNLALNYSLNGWRTDSLLSGFTTSTDDEPSTRICKERMANTCRKRPGNLTRNTDG